MTWTQAYAWAVGILVGFFVATVWLPDLLLDLLGSGGRLARDAVVTIVWAAAVVASLWLVHTLQKRGRI